MYAMHCTCTCNEYLVLSCQISIGRELRKDVDCFTCVFFILEQHTHWHCLFSVLVEEEFARVHSASNLTES